MAEYSPMMQKYLETKEEYKDCILFYRLGDFYEMFFEDAKTVSRELDLALTGKACGQAERAPMCGVPFHSVDVYLSKLVSKGYKVAICEQVEDPKTAKGLVKREVTRIVTPGTNLSAESLEDKKNQFICSVYMEHGGFGFAACDVSTGQFSLTEVPTFVSLAEEIYKFSPAEIIASPSFLAQAELMRDLKERLGILVTEGPKWYYNERTTIDLITEHFGVHSLSALGLDDFPEGTLAAGALLNYLLETQMNELSHITHITPYNKDAYMLLNQATRRNLELTETMREKRTNGSLLWVLDKTKTAMGGRLLRMYLTQPLIDLSKINARHEAVSDLMRDLITREELREYLNAVYDLERLLGRITYRSANPRDLIAFHSSLQYLPAMKDLLQDYTSPLLCEIREKLDPLEDLCELITRAIQDDPPLTVREGGIIKDGYLALIDEYRNAATDGKTWLAQIEVSERKKTGIKNLRIKYNKVFGYYLEVTKSNLDLVPDYFIRKQTLTNVERFITPELKELEDKILGAQDKLTALEYNTFQEILTTIGNEVERIQQTANALAMLDVFLSLAQVADKNHYVRPEMTTDDVLEIKNGRHPVVERTIHDALFVDNDTYLNDSDQRICIITGPNMAGKSTYMRQVALLTLMTQAGSFIPATSANISPVDRIFTRIGASDDLVSGQSTFMVEMNEVAQILKYATEHSLIVLDEVGRGTSTFDGMSIARAVIEYIDKKIRAKTLFATHYHELTDLAETSARIENFSVAVRERGNEVIFLRRIKQGGADKSYGIQVAKLAGLPKSVMKRAEEILKSMETAEPVRPVANKKSPAQSPGLFMAQDMKDLLALDVPSLTPIEAMAKLYELQQQAKKELGQ